MKLTRIEITNFRCFGPLAEGIDFEGDLTAFVGGNGSGKTAVMSALARMFGVGNPQRLVRRSDFHVPPEAAGAVDGTRLSIDCTFSFPTRDDGRIDEAIPEFATRVTIDGQVLVRARMRLEATWTDDGTPDGAVEEELRWIRSSNFVFADCSRVLASERSQIQLIYVPANRNAYDQVTSLLKGRLWKAALWSEALREALGTGSSTVQEQFDGEAPAAFVTERLTRRWREVHMGDTGATPMLRVADTRVDDLVRRAEFVLTPDPSGYPRRLEELSDGQRSLFHIALTAATLEMERDALSAPQEDVPFDQERLRRTHLTILAIEEPENSLSPFFLSRIMTQAREIGGLPGAQVLVSSHSASILSRVEPTEVRHFRLDQAERRSSVRPLRLPPDATEAATYVRSAVRAYPELYFARFVILAEGESEAIVIPRIAEAMGIPLDRSFVPIVPLGGRFVRHFWQLLRGLGIPYATLLDLDAGRRHGGRHTIAYVVGELRAIGRSLTGNRLVLGGKVSLADLQDLDDAELVRLDQSHPWLEMLRREGVFFSSPLDLDFAMSAVFSEAYRVPRKGGRGPTRGADALETKKDVTLKTGGISEIYGSSWDETFVWYPYLFLSRGKPATHMEALGRIPSETLARDAPEELESLLLLVKRRLGIE